MVTRAISPVGGGSTSPRVHRKDTMSSDVLVMLRVWLLRPDQDATLASSVAMEEVLEAGTIIISVFKEGVARSDSPEIRCTDDEHGGPQSRALDYTGIDG